MRRKLGKSLCSLVITLTMIFGLIPGMSLTTYAGEECETLNTNTGDDDEYTYTGTHFKVEVNLAMDDDGFAVTNDGKYYGIISALNGETITKLVIVRGYYDGEPVLSSDTAVKSASGDTFTFTNVNSSSVKITGTGEYYCQIKQITIYYGNPSVTVTYSVVNGTWADGTTTDITETVTSGSSPASVPTGMIAASGYTGGAWDTDPSGATITGDTKYTYTFTAIPTYTVTYSVVNGTWADGKTTDITETVQSGSKPASIPTGMIASSGYTGGSWDTDPSGATISGDITFTYTFEAISTYTVTYSVVNGTWADGTTADKTETVQSGSKPASVPTGMIASSGYTGGAWDTDPSGATITGNTKYTYTFTAIPTYTVTYSVVNGTWADGKTTDIKETVQSGSKPASVPTGMIASSGYTGGAWDTDPSGATITGNKTFTYTFKSVPANYTVAEGGNSTLTIGNASDLVITVKRDVADDTCFSHFTGVEIDGKALVNGTDYTAVAGSTVVTIKAATLNNLSEGGHTITIVFDDGKIVTSVTAKAASGGAAVPSTGESLAPTLFIGIAFIAVSGVMITVILVQKKRKNIG